LAWVSEYFFRSIKLDQFSQIKERGKVGAARRLLHIVRHDDDRKSLFERMYELFDFCRRDRVERRTRFIHQDDVRFSRDGAGDTQTLLLTSRKAERALLQPIFDFVPERRTCKTILNGLIYRAPVMNPCDPKPVSYILVDRFREWVRLLENHSHSLPEHDHIHTRPMDIDAIDPNLTRRNFSVIDQVVHPINATQQRRLSAAGRSDQRRHFLFGDLEANTV
jgi:hypothetical protein